MMICLIIGNLLLIGIVSATPLYINATMGRILHQDMRNFQIEYESYPAVMSLEFNFNSAAPNARINTYLNALNYYSHGIVTDMGVPARRTIRQDIMSAWHLTPYIQRDVSPRPRITNLTGVSGFENYITITHGRAPSHQLVDGNIIEVVITEQALLRNNLLLNELLAVTNTRLDEYDNPTLFVKIVGMYDLAEGSDEFWSIANIDHHVANVLMSDDLLLRYFIFNYRSDFRIRTTWSHLLDYRAMNARGVPHYLATLESHEGRFSHANSAQVFNFTENFSGILEGHSERAGPLATTLWVLQVPIYVMLAFYIYMVSRQILQLEQNEISVIKSRGASRKQILGLYTMQGLFIAVICYPLGIFIGVQICRVLGASNGFLNLVSRAAIIVEITPDALIYAGLAMVLSFLTMFLPVIRFSKVGIVDHKRSRTGKIKKPVWQRFFLDVICLGIAIYALYNFNAQGDNIALQLQQDQGVDPLLLLSSSLFIMGLGLLCLRVFPYAVKLVFKIGQRFWSPSAYASLVKVIRSAGEEQFIMIFLLFTLSVGTFSAQAARTINLNSEHQIRYLAGADLTFREFWRSIDPSAGPGADTGATQLVFFEPDIDRFTHFEEVEAMTRVKIEEVSTRQLGGMPAIDNVQFMAIETDTFGQTIWFRDDLLRNHINHFLNALASRSDGILVSYVFRDIHGLSVGDTLHFADRFDNSIPGVIMGFVEHFPGFAAVQRIEIDEQVFEVEQPLIVANLGHVQTQWAVRPYQIWMRTNTETNRFFYDFVEENRISLVEFTDAKADVVESRSDPILQGTNGVLTVGFIVTLVICFTGFLIYWILSIRSRVLQFGIFRAMGMSMSSLLGLLVNEQFFITFTAIALGAMVGEISSRLFVPLIQMSYSAADQVIPLQIVIERSDYVNLYTVVGIMIVICLAVLAVYISKIKIAQALKLGED